MPTPTSSGPIGVTRAAESASEMIKALTPPARTRLVGTALVPSVWSALRPIVRVAEEISRTSNVRMRE